MSTSGKWKIGREDNYIFTFKLIESGIKLAENFRERKNCFGKKIKRWGEEEGEEEGLKGEDGELAQPEKDVLER